MRYLMFQIYLITGLFEFINSDYNNTYYNCWDFKLYKDYDLGYFNTNIMYI